MVPIHQTVSKVHSSTRIGIRLRHRHRLQYTRLDQASMLWHQNHQRPPKESAQHSICQGSLIHQPRIPAIRSEFYSHHLRGITTHQETCDLRIVAVCRRGRCPCRRRSLGARACGQWNGRSRLGGRRWICRLR